MTPFAMATTVGAAKPGCISDGADTNNRKAPSIAAKIPSAIARLARGERRFAVRQRATICSSV